jgi:hypothetical protein
LPRCSHPPKPHAARGGLLLPVPKAGGLDAYLDSTDVVSSVCISYLSSCLNIRTHVCIHIMMTIKVSCPAVSRVLRITRAREHELSSM